VPGRVPRPSARRRLGQPDPIARPEYLHIGHAVTDAVIPRLVVTILRAVEDEGQREIRVVCEVPAIIRGQMGGALTVPAGYRLDPARGRLAPLRVAEKVDGTRFGPVDIASPEQPDIPVPECAPARDALHRHLDGPIGKDLVPRAALQAPIR